MHLFGSALRDDFDPDRSDIDLLVEFQLPGVNYVGGRAYLIVSEHSCRAGHRPRSRR